MSYTYLKEVTVEEHLLYASEIAEYYNIRATTGPHNGHNRLVGCIIEEYIKDNNIVYEQLYYNSAHLGKVYPGHIYIPAINLFLSNHKKNNGVYKFPSGKSFKYIISKPKQKIIIKRSV